MLTSLYVWLSPKATLMAAQTKAPRVMRRILLTMLPKTPTKGTVTACK